jgi:hypothetical protein
MEGDEARTWSRVVMLLDEANESAALRSVEREDCAESEDCADGEEKLICCEARRRLWSPELNRRALESACRYKSEGEGGRSVKGTGEVARSKSSSRAGRIIPASLSVGERCLLDGAGREAEVTAMSACRGRRGCYLGLAVVLLNMFDEPMCGGETFLRETRIKSSGWAGGTGLKEQKTLGAWT